MNIPECAVELEGTPYVMLKTDGELPYRAKLLGTIAIESYIASLPEVLALQPGQVVVDVGAFIGDTAIIFLERGCKVFAFEPFPDAYQCLLYNAPAAIAFNVAVGDGQPVELNYAKTDTNDGNRSVSIKAGGIATFRLDNLQLRSTKLIKIDVEGHELEVLAGAAKTIQIHRPIILIEANDIMLKPRGKSKQDIRTAIEAMGYSVQVCFNTEESDLCDYICHPL
jgi:FkbM family methyltransferase